MNRLTRGRTQGLAQRLKLVGVEADAGPERGLEEVGIGGSDAVPAERVQVSREPLWRVESARGDGIPVLSGHDPRIQFPIPKDFEGLTLRVIVNA